MTRLPQRFIEDRALRDAARAVLTEDIERLRASLEEQGIASRVSSGVSTTISSRIRTGARDVLAQAKAQAGDHKGVLAVLIGAIILWFAREPILDWIDELAGLEPEDDNETAATAPEGEAQGDPA
ncbi:MAG: hypothetical protein EDM03_00305 [Porphyrobacter sp. IPPAS B-1204]|nr:MAG: hypothetical protein EDM03_00305 [Porphyrobacter sp. IPPAS B-1204]